VEELGCYGSDFNHRKAVSLQLDLCSHQPVWHELWVWSCVLAN